MSKLENGWNGLRLSPVRSTAAFRNCRSKNELWPALENYRKASRATDGRDEEVEKRMHDLEGQLKAGMAGTNVKLVIYKDDKGQLFVLDDMDKVPARYKDRALEVNPAQAKPGAGGLR